MWGFNYEEGKVTSLITELIFKDAILNSDTKIKKLAWVYWCSIFILRRIWQFIAIINCTENTYKSPCSMVLMVQEEWSFRCTSIQQSNEITFPKIKQYHLRLECQYLLLTEDYQPWKRNKILKRRQKRTFS